MQSPRPAASPISVADLGAALDGRAFGPGEPGYDDGRTVFYGGPEMRPAVVARPAGAPDVARVVSLARETGLELAVRGGGHSNARYGTTDGGIVLDLRDLEEFDVDLQDGTAWIGAGLTAGEVTKRLAPHGVVVAFGDTGSVGIGGITLGGGVGYLTRLLGLTIDSVVAADVVTADGRLLRADGATNPDLFWAIRGGGGNFGVVTRFQYRLHGLAGVVGGMLILPATVDTIAGFVAAADAAPEELTTIANVMPCPPMPFVPAEHHGRLVLLAQLAYAGAADAGERVVAPFRGLATPIVDMIRPMAYPELYPPDQEGYHPVGVGRTLFADSIDRGAAAAIVDHLGASTAQVRVCQLRVLGGAMARVPVDATAFAHRRSRIMVNVAALYQAPEERAAHEAWVTAFAAALRQGDGGAYVNFLNDEGEARVRAAYPGATWERLATIKARYDPGNLFRRNQNIPPAAADPGS